MANIFNYQSLVFLIIMAEETTKLKEVIDEIFKRADEYSDEAIEDANKCLISSSIIDLMVIESRMEVLRTILHAGHDIIPKEDINKIYRKSIEYPDETREKIVNILKEKCGCE